ncbi:MAG: methylated-DNA--[protein]-cysteine S-methyltransferase [Pseudomonadota bacterium]
MLKKKELYFSYFFVLSNGYLIINNYQWQDDILLVPMGSCSQRNSKTEVKKPMIQCCYKSPMGLLIISVEKSRLIALEFARSKFERQNAKCENRDQKEVQKDFLILNEVKKQLDLYFKGKLKKFDFLLTIQGTEFQKKVWKAMLKIPYGKQLSYKDIALKINHSKACRAVGTACNKNKIAIIIPCHRVIGSNGKLGGYATGLKNKKFLISLENENSLI